jgi:hypothetical protein
VERHPRGESAVREAGNWYGTPRASAECSFVHFTSTSVKMHSFVG